MFIAASIVSLLLAASTAVSATPLEGRDGQPQCSQGSGTYKCSDAQTACNGVSRDNIGFPKFKGSLMVSEFGTAQVWLGRAITSASKGDMNALCNQIVATCCTGETGTKSTVAFPAGEKGLVSIVPTE
jgi:hypothetical protein